MRHWIFILTMAAGLAWVFVADAADSRGSAALTHWTAEGHGGATAQLRTQYGHLQLDYSAPKGEGYIWLRRRLDVDLPERYTLQFNLRGRGSVADFEVRLTDPAARNVWNWRRYDHHWPQMWQTLSIPDHSLEFAWGPSQSPLARAGSLEWLITPGVAGKASIEFGDVAIEAKPRLVDPDRKPAIQATSALPGHPSDLAIDASEATFWHSDRGKGGESLTLDFGGYRTFGGLALHWCARDYARDFQLLISADGKVWQTLKKLHGRHGGRDTLYLPDSEARYLRLSLLDSEQGSGYCLRDMAVMPDASPNAFFTNLARRTLPGTYPKYFLGQQTYFTVIGAPDSRHEGLLNEEGALETGQGGHTLEPFLFRDGRLVTWRDVRLEQTLGRGELPIPSVIWHDREIKLQIMSYATGGEEQTLFARYRLENNGTRPIRLKLFLAIRPFQVNPPWQSLNLPGGFSPLRSAEWQAGHLRVNDHLAVVPLTTPEGVGATTFDQGEIVETLRQGRLPEQTAARDAHGLVSAALAYDLTLPAGGGKELFLAIPHGDPKLMSRRWARHGPAGAGEHPRQVTEDWTRRLAGPEFTGPPAAQRLIQAMRTNLAYLLINRDAPALYPGSRAYARAWIRDGALMAAALLGMGHAAEVRDFIGWYAEYQRPDGTIPCCIDRRGADPQVEHDSHGEFIYLIAEYYRHTHDDALLRRLWPRVRRTVGAIDGLRQQRKTPAYQSGPQSIFFGLMPESISHEGYAGKPVHAFWDGFWTLRGLKDAVELARVMGDEDAIGKFMTLRDEFRQDLYAALERTLTERNISFLPGSVELGDFDANSTAISINIGGEEANLPAAPLKRTFDDYWAYVQKRRQGQQAWDAYTPYEVRSVEAFVRLGDRERAWGLLDFLMTGQRPPAWHHWAEVVWRDPATPKFFGDMPHTWIGAEFIRAIRSLYVFERERDQALVLAAGIPEDWLKAGAVVGVGQLPTWFGNLSYRLRQTGPGELLLSLSGPARPPPGEIVIRPPLPRPLLGATVNGQPISSFTAHEAKIGSVPAEVVLRY